MSTDPKELQEMLNFCQSWSEESQLQLNAEKSKVMAFHEPKDMKKARKKPRKVNGQNMYPAQFHIFHSFPEHAQRSAPLKEVTEFDYLGLRLRPLPDNEPSSPARAR